MADLKQSLEDLDKSGSEILSQPELDMASELETIELQSDVKKEIDHWVSKYPENQSQSAIMGALMAAQNLQGKGYLPKKLIKAVADYLNIPVISALEVATFYSMYEHKFPGKYKLCVCTNLSCKMKGANQIVSHLKNKLGIDFNEVTADQKFGLKSVECLGACTKAPVIQIDDEYHEELTIEKVDQLLDNLK